MNTHSESRGQETVDHLDSKFSSKDAEELSQKNHNGIELDRNEQNNEPQKSDTSNSIEIASKKIQDLEPQDKINGQISEDYRLEQLNQGINGQNDSDNHKKELFGNEKSNGQINNVNGFHSNDLENANKNFGSKEHTASESYYAADFAENKQHNNLEVVNKDQNSSKNKEENSTGQKLSFGGNSDPKDEEEHKEIMHNEKVKENREDNQTHQQKDKELTPNSSEFFDSSKTQQEQVIKMQKDNNESINANDSTKSESSTAHYQEKNSIQVQDTSKPKGCLCHSHEHHILHSKHNGCPKKVHFKDEDLLASSDGSSRHLEEFVEQIPIDKLDNMTSGERFQEYDVLIDKGISLRNRNKYVQAANFFEMAVDVINPIYFRDSPTMLKQSQKSLIVGLMNAAACHFAAERFNDTCKNACHILKLDPFNLEAIYYYGTSKMKLGDVNEAAKVFFMAKKANKGSDYRSFREKIFSQLEKLLENHPELDTKTIEESVDHLFSNKKRTSHKKALIYAATGFIPAVTLVYFFTMKVNMPKRRRIVTSISSGILISVLGFLFGRLY